MSDLMRIGELTERAGVTQRTVRYYESIGLLPPGEREGHGHHYYTEEALARLRKIDQLKKLGLSLEEIGNLLNLDIGTVKAHMHRAVVKLRHELRDLYGGHR